MLAKSMGQSSDLLRFRKAKPEDLNAVLALTNECIGLMRSEGIDQWDESYPDRQTLEEDVQEQTLYVCEMDQKICASATLNRFQDPEYASVSWKLQQSPVAVIHRLMVAPKSQGQGIAKNFVSYLERQARLYGFRSIRLDAFMKNPRAIQLYEKLGYGRLGTIQLRKGQFWCFEKSIPQAIDSVGLVRSSEEKTFLI
jgi:ribosomal protein S18 acetylase RimI-like enzyme